MADPMGLGDDLGQAVLSLLGFLTYGSGDSHSWFRDSPWGPVRPPQRKVH